MNISEQLNLLENIKEDIKIRLIEIGAKINDLTPFKEYSKYILMPEKSTITDKVCNVNQPTSIKENVFFSISENICNKNQANNTNEQLIFTISENTRMKNQPINIKENIMGHVSELIYCEIEEK